MDEGLMDKLRSGLGGLGGLGALGPETKPSLQMPQVASESEEDDSFKFDSSQFMIDQYNEKGMHQVWIQVGSKFIPEYPIRDDTEAYYQLRKTVGHPIDIFSRWYHSTRYSWTRNGEN